MTMQHEEDFHSWAHEEPSTLDDETSEAVTGGGLFSACFGKPKVIPSLVTFELKRTASGNRQFSNIYGALKAKRALPDATKWQIEDAIGGNYALRPANPSR